MRLIFQTFLIWTGRLHVADPVITAPKQETVYLSATSQLFNKNSHVNFAIKLATNKDVEKKTYPVIYVLINFAVFVPLMKGCVRPAKIMLH